MAQLGAIAMWRSYKENGDQALEKYMEALNLGYTKSISEIYNTAGIEFNFSALYVKELAGFIKKELNELEY
jgi:oligoendopeptidase F